MSLELKEQYNKIYKYCYFKVRNRDIAEDLTQETFLRYFKQTSYISRGKPLAYLYIIAKNLCVDYYGKSKLTHLDENLIASDRISTLETTITVRQAVKHLPHEQQELIFLRFSNELGINEIASIMGISRYVVYRKLNKALSELNKYLKEEEFDE